MSTLKKKQKDGRESQMSSHPIEFAGPKPFNLSVDLRQCEHNLQPESMLIGELMVEHLYENMVLSLLKRKVESTFKPFSIRSTLSVILHTMNAQNLSNDPGDNETSVTNQMFTTIDYDYAEDQVEPEPCEIDQHVPRSKMGDTSIMHARCDMETFNAKYMSHVGNFNTRNGRSSTKSIKKKSKKPPGLIGVRDSYHGSADSMQSPSRLIMRDVLTPASLRESVDDL